MQMTRRKKLTYNTVLSLTYEAVAFICGFILPRAILASYGSNINGLLNSITHFLGFISFAEMGIGAVILSNLYKPLAENDNCKVSKIMASAKRFYRIVALILVAYTIFLMIAYPLFTDTSMSHISTATLILIISISSFAQYIFGISNTLLLKADQKQYITLIINITALILNTVVSVVLIKAGKSIHFVKLASSLIYIVRPLCLSLYVNRKYALDRNIKYEGEPIQQKWNGIAQHFAYTVMTSTDTVVLTLLSTLENVSIYSVYNMIAAGIRNIVYALTAGVEALLGNMYANNETKKLNKAFDEYEWLMHTFSIFIFTMVAVLIEPFVLIYTKGINDTNYSVPAFAIMISYAMAARCIQLPYNSMVQVAGHFKQTQNSAILEPIINIVLSVSLVGKLGLFGIAIGTFIGLLYRAVYLAIYLTHNILYNKISVFIKHLVIDVFSAGVMYFSAQLIDIETSSYIKWIIFACLIGVIFAIESGIINFLFYRSIMIDACRHALKRKFKRVS